MYERPGRISLKIYAVVTVAMCSFDGARRVTFLGVESISRTEVDLRVEKQKNSSTKR